MPCAKEDSSGWKDRLGIRTLAEKNSESLTKNKTQLRIANENTDKKEVSILDSNIEGRGFLEYKCSITTGGGSYLGRHDLSKEFV